MKSVIPEIGRMLDEALLVGQVSNSGMPITSLV